MRLLHRSVEGATGMAMARREAILFTAPAAAAAAAAAALPTTAAHIPSAASVSAKSAAAAAVYSDEVDGWSMAVPSGWEQELGGAQGAVGTCRVVAFFPKGDHLSTNITVVITTLAADYTVCVHLSYGHVGCSKARAFPPPV
jgi:ABC-type branched-subunit amino acid transport system substrate-binding protein